MSGDKKLTDLKLKNVEPKDKKYRLGDGAGLSLIVYPDGNKIWNYRFMMNGKSYETTFQSYPTTSLAEARKKADDYRNLIKKGINPIEYYKTIKEKDILNKKGNFGLVFKEWMEKIQKPALQETTYKRKYLRANKWLYTPLKDKHIQEITLEDLKALLQKIEQEGKIETARRLMGYIKDLWGWAIVEGYCTQSPLAGVEKKHILSKKTKVVHYAKITDEIYFKELVNAIYNNHNSLLGTRIALLIVLHIPLRAKNLVSLKWEHIDFKKKLLTIPREEMKMKNPNLIDYMVPLSDEVMRILQEHKSYIEKHKIKSDYICIDNKFKGHIAKETPTVYLKRLGFIEEKRQSLHSFRGTFRTMIEEREHIHNIINSKDIIKHTLDHSNLNRVDLAYSNKLNLIERQKPLMQWWSNFVLSFKD